MSPGRFHGGRPPHHQRRPPVVRELLRALRPAALHVHAREAEGELEGASLCRSLHAIGETLSKLVACWAFLTEPKEIVTF